MSDSLLPCRRCESPYGYYSREGLYACPQCGHEWDPAAGAEKGPVVVDANGNRLSDGDHNIDCRVDGFGAMALRSEFVSKA